MGSDEKLMAVASRENELLAAARALSTAGVGLVGTKRENAVRRAEHDVCRKAVAYANALAEFGKEMRP